MINGHDGDDRGPLAREIDSLAYEYLLKTGQKASHILLPKRSPSIVKEFVEALCAEVPAAGSPPFVFDCFMRQGREAEFRGLQIAVYDGNDLIVGGERHLH